jgi:rare lipoprotein A (peptidoglycan hydrolase)
MPAYLARTGLAVFAMLFAITLLTERIADGRALVAGANAIDLPQLNELAMTRIERSDVLVADASFAAAPSRVAPPPQASAPAVAPTASAGVAAPVQSDAVVLASWYGPGFYGNTTACGQTYTPEILGVAHRTLPCGTSLTLSHGSRSVTVTVIDRGPYVAGRAIDLSTATKLVLGCTDLCTVRMQIAH